MAAFVKSLQHKASRARLRQSQLSEDAPTTPQRHPNHPYGAGFSPNTPSPTSSAASASSPSLLFWRKPVASPLASPVDSPVLQPSTVSAATAPKPILRRASPGPNEFGVSISPTANTNVRFPDGQHNAHPRRASIVGTTLPPGAQRPFRGPPPPNAFRQTSMPMIPRREGGEERSRAVSPVNSVHSVASTNTLRHAASRAQSVSPAAGTGRTDSPSGAPVAHSNGYDPLSPTGRASAMSFNSDDRRRSMYRASPPSSPCPSQRDVLGEPRAQRYFSDSHRPAPPPPIHHDQALQPRQRQASAPFHSQPLATEVPQVRYRPLSQIQPGVQRPRRPSSVLLDGGRRRSSRPTQPSSSRTRDSITSLSSLSAVSLSSGYSGTSPSASASSISSRSVTPVSPVSPVSPTSASSFQFPPVTSPLTSPLSSFQSLSAVPAPVPVAPLHAPQALPASQHAMRRILATVPASPDSVERLSPVPHSPEVVHRLTAASLAAYRTVTPVGSSPSTSPFASPSLASTPGGACPTSPGPLVTPKVVARTPTDHRRLQTYAGDGSPLPMFKVIPATPSNRKVTNMLSGGDEDDDADGMSDKPPARILDFGEPGWRRDSKERDSGPCVSLNDCPLASWAFDPIGLPGEMLVKAPAPSPAVTPPLDGDMSQSASPTPSATPPKLSTPPPIPAKSPRRKSLFMGHDDGRSISRSLAELATLACDLPREHESFGNELTVAAQQAAARFAAARAATDTPKRPPLCAPPRLPPPPIPTNVLPFTKVRGPTTPTDPSIPRQVPYAIGAMDQAQAGPLPPSPPYSSHRSLPSLGSYDSVPSGDEVSDASEHEREQEARADLSSTYTYDSSVSLASTLSDTEEALISTVRTLTPLPSRGESRASSHASRHSRLLDLDDSTATPKLRAKAFRLDFSNPSSRVGSPGPQSPALGSPRTPTLPQHREYSPERELLSTFDGEFPLPPSPPSRVHRMSAAAANPNRAAFYGAASIVRSAMSSTASLHEQAGGAPLHAPHGSISSLASMASTSSMEPCSDVDDDEVLTASIVAFQPYGPAKYVDPRTSEVGVAF